MAKLHVVLVLAVLTLSLAGCKKESPPSAPATAPKQAPQVQAPPSAPDAVSVANISLGKALGPDKKVAAATDTFAKGDTSSQTISASGPVASEFHVNKPDGWPLGDYEVEIWVNDKSAGTKKFVVK